MRSTLSLALCLALGASPGPAQTPPPLTKGARVRVTFPGENGQPTRQLTGTLERLVDDTLVIVRGYLPAQTLNISRGTQLEVDATRHRVGVPVLVGVLVGIGAAAELWGACGRCVGGVPPVLAIPGAGMGGLLGWGVGNALGGTTWVPVQTAGLRIVATPMRASLALSVAAAW